MKIFAEFGYGLYLASKNRRNDNLSLANELIEKGNISSELSALLKKSGVRIFNNGDMTLELQKKIVPLLEKESDAIAKKLLNNKRVFVKTSNWIFGGDGWAYDIGFGGLDHVIAQNQDINILIFDTEIYSNTGGQSSKSTPFGAIAKFVALHKVRESRRKI